MTYSRVLGTIGLIGATVLGATGPATLSHAATANAGKLSPKHAPALSPAASKAAALQALRVGYFTTRNGKREYLSSALVNTFKGAGGSKASGAAGAHAAGRADSSPPPAVGGGVRANQDFGYYTTGNGALFHNTVSVAVDPAGPQHIVVSATDTRLGTDGSILNISSNPVVNATGGNVGPCFQEITPNGGAQQIVPVACSLIQALGGPGIYDSVDAAHSFTDLVIPDSLSGAVPDAINQAGCPEPIMSGGNFVTAQGIPGAIYPLETPPIGGPLPASCLFPTSTPVTTAFVDATVGCINASGTFSPPSQSSVWLPNACVPYDSVGDNSVAFDSTGNLYSVGDGLVSVNPIAGANVFTDAPQTDLLLNVSPAVQPIDPAAGPNTTFAPNAAGRTFNNLQANPGCNPAQASSNTCLHNEVIASTAASNFLFPSTGLPGDTTLASPAFEIGRNWQADDGFGGGPGLCGTTDFCLIDQPYIAINGVADPVAAVTYTLLDFTLAFSNVYLTTAIVPVAGGSLPVWSAPQQVDNPLGDNILTFGGNPFCTFTDFTGTVFNTFCAESWGAEPTVGPDGAIYIVYENGDNEINTPTGFGAADAACAVAGCNQILVATVGRPATATGLSTIVNTTYVSDAVDHDMYQSAVSTDAAVLADPAGLDPDSGAYFTIPDRPTISVTSGTVLNGSSYPGGVVIVAWTDQRSSASAANPFAGGTRIWYATGATTSAIKPLAFNLLAGTPANPNNPPVIAEVMPVTAVVNQFFPWLAASQFVPQAGSLVTPNIFIGFYQETPAVAAGIGTSGSAAVLNFWVGKSNNFGGTPKAGSPVTGWGFNTASTPMPLPTAPLSAPYCAVNFGFTYTGGPTVGVPIAFPSATAAAAACNAVPYFGTYTGAAWGGISNPALKQNGNQASNDAYLAYTNTNPSNRNFLVSGSQDVYVVHAN